VVASRWRSFLSKKLHAPHFTMPSSPALQGVPLRVVRFQALERKVSKEVCLSELQTPGNSTSKARSVPRRIGRVWLSDSKATPMAEPTKEQIIHRAYEIWEKNNKPEGRDEEFYHQAEQELRDEDKSSPLRTPDNL
jgi:hypothetical protein